MHRCIHRSSGIQSRAARSERSGNGCGGTLLRGLSAAMVSGVTSGCDDSATDKSGTTVAEIKNGTIWDPWTQSTQTWTRNVVRVSGCTRALLDHEWVLSAGDRFNTDQDPSTIIVQHTLADGSEPRGLTSRAIRGVLFDMATGDGSVTMLLQAWSRGDRDAFDRLTPIVYDELRRLAGAYLRRERPDHTLSPTELVSEAFLRLVGGEHPAYEHRVQFFAVAARHMRRILVDHARRRTAAKRGGPDRPVTLDEQIVGGERPEELVALDDALEALAAMDERKARAVELHYFGGMSHKEIAAELSVHENTVARDLRLAQAWLHRQMMGAAGRGDSVP